MRFAIQIHGFEPSSSDINHAAEFIKAAVAGGHEVLRVFCYQEGVRHGFDSAGSASAAWDHLAGHIDLVCCSSAAERRGLAESDLRPGFRLGGLGQWMEACLAADRILVFPS